MPPNPKAKNDIQKQKLTINTDKPPVSMIEKDGPISDSPVPIDPEEGHPGSSPQDILAGITLPEHKAVHPTVVLPNDNNPFSGL